MDNVNIYNKYSNDFVTLYYQNCLLFIFYLFWIKIIVCSNQEILFRKSYILHNIITLFVYLIYINNTSLQMNNVVILECLPLIYYILKDFRNIVKLDALYILD